mmetsp:Transcript_111412/g.316063  ORF Transcript_111412/g.316063 Transcript_111412/m.316063 type:complete len:297 (+) Transcript_111412:45-935(+)
MLPCGLSPHVQGLAPEDEDVGWHHLAVDPWRMTVAYRRGVIRHDPAVVARTQLSHNREETCVAGRVLEAPDELDSILPRLAPFLPRRETVDSSRLPANRAGHQIDDLLPAEVHPGRCELVLQRGVPAEQQDLALADAGQPWRIKSPGYRHPQVGPCSQRALLRVEQLGPESCRVSVLESTDRHQVASGGELERDLADTAAVHGARFRARWHRLPLDPVARLLEQDENVLGAVVVAEVAALVRDGVVSSAIDFDLPRHLARVAHLLRLRPLAAVARRRVEDVERLELPVRGLEGEEV